MSSGVYIRKQDESHPYSNEVNEIKSLVQEDPEVRLGISFLMKFLLVGLINAPDVQFLGFAVVVSVLSLDPEG